MCPSGEAPQSLVVEQIGGPEVYPLPPNTRCPLLFTHTQPVGSHKYEGLLCDIELQLQSAFQVTQSLTVDALIHLHLFLNLLLTLLILIMNQLGIMASI